MAAEPGVRATLRELFVVQVMMVHSSAARFTISPSFGDGMVDWVYILFIEWLWSSVVSAS